jgi:hypothetical protein
VARLPVVRRGRNEKLEKRVMALLKQMVEEILGLFVDDGYFALAVIVWLALVWLVLPHISIQADCNPVILFAGLIAILLESVLRRARRH